MLELRIIMPIILLISGLFNRIDVNMIKYELYKIGAVGII